MMKLPTSFFVCCLILIFFHSNFSQRSVTNHNLIFPQNGEPREVSLYDASYALVIGMSKYRYWKPLDGPVKDVEEVKTVLIEHGFNVQVEMDLTGEALEQKINEFIKKYGLDGNKRLVIYFAGHGGTLVATDRRELGYIVPVDAPLPEKNETEFKRVALSMQKIESFAKEIQTKHALFIFDSCFSGQLLSFRDPGKIIPPAISEYLNNPVRQIISSGSGNQKVPDDSTFRRYFVSGLRGEADLDRDGYITASELAKYLYTKVTNDSSRYQTPQYGRIQDANLDRGDMVFFLTRNPDNVTEEQAWLEATKQNTIQSYTVFVNSYRNSKYVSEALRTLVALSNSIESRQPPPGNSILPPLTTQRAIAVRSVPFEFTTLSVESGSEKTTMINESFEEDLGEGVKLKLVKVPEGKFKMGSLRTIEEKPVHDVKVEEFYIGSLEVTQKQWERVAKMEKVKINLPKKPAITVTGDNLPAVGPTWDEAQEFCDRLSRSTGRIYTLPSEAEWEYAARAGTATSFYFGSKINAEIVNFNASVESNEGIKGFNRNHLIDAGSLGIANKYGIFDMYGNAAEWCQDGWEDTYDKAPDNGTARIGSSYKKVIRGGSYSLVAGRVCSTCRSSETRDTSSEYIGFRVVMRSPILK